MALSVIVRVSPRLKRVFSGLSQGGTGNPIASQNIVQATAPAEVTIVGAVDAYLSDFGRIELAPDIFMPDGVMEIIAPEYATMAPLPGRDMENEEYAKIGNAAGEYGTADFEYDRDSAPLYGGR